jgi:hypothetical protein
MERFHRPFRTDLIGGDEPGTVCRANFRRPCRDEGESRKADDVIENLRFYK